MAFPFNDQVYTKSFTPREYQVNTCFNDNIFSTGKSLFWE